MGLNINFKMNREELIKVYDDTVRRVESGEYDSELSSWSARTPEANIHPCELNHTTKVSVINEDCMVTANRLSRLRRTCLLNMASYKKPGGGVKSGAMSQEEELARRSNLIFGLSSLYYPLQEDKFLFTKGVTFFKDSDYNIIPSFKVDVITMAALNINGKDKPDGYETVMRDKIEAIIRYPCKLDCGNLVLSAFGCGVFKNDPTFVANEFKKAIQKYGGIYSNITFSILNDHNSVDSNYEIFKKILQ